MPIRFLLAAASTACLLAGPVQAELVINLKSPKDRTEETEHKPALPAEPVFAGACFEGMDRASPEARLAAFPAAPEFAPLDRRGAALPSDRWASAPWRSVTQSDPALRKAARPVAEVMMCHVTEDGLPRDVSFGSSPTTLPSGYVSKCTGVLLPGKRLLIPNYCLQHPALERAGFTTARVLVRLGVIGEAAHPLIFETDPSAAIIDDDLFVAVLPISGDPLKDHSMDLAGSLPAYHPLVMLHFPLGQPMQVSSGNCLVLPKADNGDTRLLHSCETAPGSGGGLLLDARTLKPWGLHFARTSGGKRQALDLRTIDKGLKLGLSSQ